jgi:type IV secretory pathway TraG/TraD family ATPase VirD4
MLPLNTHGSSGSIWQESAQALLAACLIRFENIGEILDALADVRRLSRILSEKTDDVQRLAIPFIVSAKGDGTLAAQITAVLASVLTTWADEAVRLSTAGSDFSAGDLVEQPSVIVLTCPGRQRGAFARYLGTVLRMLMLDLDRIGEDHDGSIPTPVAVVLDEFPTLGKLDSLVTDVNLVRKRRIAILIAAQTIGQFQMIYGKPATDALLAGLATQIIFGGCDQETAETFSRASGLATERLSVRFGHPPQIRQRPLLTPDEIQAPARGNATIFARYVTETHASQAILFARLMRLYERADWQEKLANAPLQEALIVERSTQ